MIRVCINFNNHDVTGEANFIGPFHECDWSEIISVEPENTDPRFRDEALSAIEAAAYEKFKSTCSNHSHDDDYDYPDEHTDYCNSRGGDYWQDPESGEYRCG